MSGEPHNRMVSGLIPGVPATGDITLIVVG